jgi:hypothetical protein
MRWMVTPFSRLVGGGKANPRSLGQLIQDAFDEGVIPVGLSAAVSGLFLILLFYFK